MGFLVLFSCVRWKSSPVMGFLVLFLPPLSSGLTNQDFRASSETSPIAQDLHLTLAEGDWWRTSFVTESWSSPLQLSVKVQSSNGCSEGATTDGTCVFGLKLYGSQHGPSASTVRCHCSHGPPPACLLRAAAPLAPWGEPLAAAAKPLYGLRSSGLPKVADLIAWVPRPRPTPESYQQSDEGSHHSGEEYRLLVPACALLSARTPTGRYYIGLRGWDGTSKLVLRADEGACASRPAPDPPPTRPRPPSAPPPCPGPRRPLSPRVAADRGCGARRVAQSASRTASPSAPP